MLTTKTAAAILAFAATALAQVEPYHQCGGNGYTGESSCVAGWECAVSNEWYSQCIPAKGGDSGEAVGEDDEEIIEDEDDCLEEVPEEDEEVIGEEDDCPEELPEEDVEEPVEEDDCPEEEEGEAEEDDEEEAPAVTSSSASPAESTPASTPASSAPTATSTPDVPDTPETPETPETPAGECSAPSGNQLIGFGSGTTGGGDGEGVTVTSCSEFESALEAGGVIKISGTLDGCDILKVNSDTSIIGVGADATITNGGLRFKDVTNVIVQNIKFHLSPEGKDLIDIESSTYIWVDHCDFSNVGITGDKDYYDGMLDIKRGSDFITVSWSVFSDHWKASLIGHSPSNGDEDSGALHVTYHHNLWSNINSRAPSIRFGTVHVYSNCYEDVPTSGVNSREGAQVLVEHSSFTNVRRAIVTDLDANLEGFANERDNLYVESDTEITQEGSWEPEYSYTPDPASCVCELLKSSAGVGVVA